MRLLWIGAAGLALLPALGGEAPGSPKGGVDAQTAKRIEAALEKGRAWLKPELAKELGGDGHGIKYEITWEKQTYLLTPGRLALQGLALLETGTPPEDPLLKGVWDRIRSKPLDTTYDASVSLLFAEGYLRAKNKGKRVGEVEPVVRAWMQKTADYLASGCYGGAWHYTCPGSASGYPVDENPKAHYSVGDGTGPQASDADHLGPKADARAKEVSWDHSNSQYAVLGLKAASLCGVKVKNARLMWRTVVYHFLKAQEASGPEVELKLAREESKYGIPDYTVDGTPQARGWTYSDFCSPGQSYATMTGAGLTALLVAQSEVKDLDPGERTRLKTAVRDALAWFQTNWSVEQNVGTPLQMRKLARYYHLYGLERIGTLTAVRSIGGHAWYPEGAEVILRGQLPDGKWSEAVDTTPEDARVKTSLALLFLARAFREDYTVGEEKR